MNYQVYNYHGSNTTPIGNPNEKIYGIELEIDDDSEYVRDEMNYLVEEDILTVPYNEHRTHNLKKVENDGSVWKEIIIRADTLENILPRVEALNILNSVVDNSDGTSAHIHINRRYLERKGITQTNLFKLFEFLAPVIFAISGRSRSSLSEWAEPRSRLDRNPVNIDWEQRAEAITHLSASSGRYTMVNCSNEDTIELRAFSNYFSFNYEYLSLYLRFVDLCVDIAENMKGKYYTNEYKHILNIVENWLKSNYPYIYQRHGLKKLFIRIPNLRTLSLQWSRLRNKVFYLENYCKYGEYKFEVLQQGVNHSKPFKVTLTNKGIKNLSIKLTEEHYATFKSYNMMVHRSLNHELKTGEGF